MAMKAQRNRDFVRISLRYMSYEALNTKII